MFIKKMILTNIKTNTQKIEGKMIKKLNKQKIVLSLMAIGLLGLANCTKKVAYEEVAKIQEKEKILSKSVIDTKSEFLMAASQQQSSRSAIDAFPFLAGDNKRVKIEIDKDVMRIVETEKDERFKSNETNTKLVLEIPIEHVQYRCAKDKYGNCTNKEEEADDIPWDSKDTMKINFGAAKSGQLDLLPIMSSQTVGENCYEEVSSRLTKADVEKDAINFQVLRTFKTRLECVTGEGASSFAEIITDATISAVYHYSLVKVDSVLSKDYKTISYPVSSKDEQTFGFFSTSRTQLDTDNNNTDKSTIQIMNRWNPNRKEIVYFLSDEFAKPENKMVKDLTYKTVDNLNKGLEISGVNFRINLKEPAGKIPGDIRNSMIVLVEDPVAASVIGYGPQTEDPKTGEIISARTVMFLGTIKKFVQYTYNDILLHKKNAKLEAAKIAKMATPNLSLAPNIVAITEAKKKTGRAFSLAKLNESVSAQVGKGAKSKESVKSAPSIGLGLQKSKIEKALKNYTAQRNEEFSGTDLKSKVKYLHLAKNCAFSPNKESIAGEISQKLADQFPDDAKDWHDLSAEEKEQVIAIILPEIWVPTLIHEMGHNLGLRHNFQGSEDKANFYSADELAQNGIEHKVVSSSVMEYIEDLKALPILGKYDIAALKFGYLREVEVKKADGTTEMVKIPNTLEKLSADLKANSLELKDYGFCTDEHTGINAGCKRFDLGTSYTEITQNLIKGYEDAYEHRNLRDGRANMSLFDDLKYASRIGGIFTELRIMMEVRERIKYRFGLADSAPEWDSIEFLKDLKTATLLGGQFMANVMLVPDTTCAVALASKPNQIIAVVNLNQIDPEAMSCAKAQLNPNYLVVGQAGKSFNSKKDPESTNNYADQIDMRGIWIDKLMATRTLMSRQIGIHSMDLNVDSFLNVPELRTGILDAVGGLLTDNVIAKVPFTLNDGSVAEFEIGYDLSTTQVIEKSIHPMIARRFGINETGSTQLQQVVAGTLARNAYDKSGVHSQDNVLSDLVSVHRLNEVSDIKPGATDQFVMIDNSKYIATKSNAYAFDAIQNMAISTQLEKVAPEKIGEILDAKLSGQLTTPTDATAEEKAVWAMSPETLDAYLNQMIKPSKFYEQLLRVLPGA